MNWPVVWRPYIHQMKAALDEKLVGEPLKLRYINGHTGPLGTGAKPRGVSENAEEMTDEQRSKTWWHKEKFGGGVYLDICCYGCLFSQWFMGDGAESVMSVGENLNTPFGDTDDNFAAIIKYADKIKVLCGLEIGTRPTPPESLPRATENFDYVLFECLDDTMAIDFYEFLEWRKLFKCKAGLAHTVIFKVGERDGLDI